jgi:hypothetical protein
MPTEDYLLKYLEKLSRVIAAMLGFRDNGFPEDALKMADGTYRELLNIDLKALTVEPTEKFSETIRKANYSASILDLLVQLTYETAIAFEQNRQPAEAHSFYRKTLELYRLLNEKDKTFSFEREMRIGEINKKIL